VEAKQLIVIGLGIFILAGGVAYFAGWLGDLSDYIPWFSDKGDLLVKTYDGMGTSDTSDDVPLANVTVTVLSTELTGTTDENGSIMFEDVEVGTYEVQAEYGSDVLTENATIEKDLVTTVTFVFNVSAAA